MPIIILDEEWELNSTGVTKQPGTQINFASGATEAEEILEAGAGHILGQQAEDPADAEQNAPETKKSDRVKQKMEGSEIPKPLPDDFPKRELLEDSGLVTRQQVTEAKDRDLLSIDGIGDQSLIDIREALK